MCVDICMEYQTYYHLWYFLWLAEGESANCFESWNRHLSLPHIWIGLFGHLIQSVLTLDPGI